MPYTRKRARRTRAYRSYRRRYNRYARKSRIPKAIGTSSANYLTACFTVNQHASLRFPVGYSYSDAYVFLSPFSSRFFQPWLLSHTQDWSGVFGLFNSYAFRKYITMYQQLKIRGVYCTVSMPSSSLGATPGLNIYFVWDRQTTVQQAAKYKAAYVTSGTPSDIRQQCMDQGIRPKRIYPGKGPVSARSKCIAKSIMERSGWIDTSTWYHQSQITYGDDIYNTNDFQLYSWRDGPTLNTFSPGCWVMVESNAYNDTDAPYYIPVEIQMRIYCDFRSPGAGMDSTETKAMLLKPNSELWARQAPDGTKIHEIIPPDTTTGMKRTKEPDEEDMCAQPATKAVEHEELPDEEEEEPSTQLL